MSSLIRERLTCIQKMNGMIQKCTQQKVGERNSITGKDDFKCKTRRDFCASEKLYL